MLGIDVYQTAHRGAPVDGWRTLTHATIERIELTGESVELREALMALRRAGHFDTKAVNHYWRNVASPDQLACEFPGDSPPRQRAV